MTIVDIEGKILLHSNSIENKDIAHCQTYLELRKKLLDEEFLSHPDEHLSELADFNERMTTALRTLWDDAQKCFDISKKMDGFDIEFVLIWNLMQRKMTTRETGLRYSVYFQIPPTILCIKVVFACYP